MSNVNIRALAALAALTGLEGAWSTGVRPRPPRKARKRFAYPNRADTQSIAHYDAAMTAWLNGGRVGTRPQR